MGPLRPPTNHSSPRRSLALFPLPHLLLSHFNHRHGSGCFCRRCLPRPTRNSHPHSRHRRNNLRSHRRFRNLPIRLSVKYVFPWPYRPSALTLYTALTVFLVVMTNLLLLIGAGLFSKAVGEFEGHAFAKLLGAQGDDALGDGPGSYRVQGNVWHLACCSPTDNLDGQGWSIFGAIFGWSNNGSRKPSFVLLCVQNNGLFNSGNDPCIRILLDRSHRYAGILKIQ